jgi:hypothetical protein
MHLSFESLVITGALGLQVSLMYIHHDTSLRSILEDDSISLAYGVRIHFCSGKGPRLWLITRPSIRSFCITHFTFTSTLRFRLSLIQPSTSSFFTCECGHELDTFDTHLVHCPFGNQQIATHDVATLTLGSQLRQGLAKVWAKNEARESNFLLSGVWESVSE